VSDDDILWTWHCCLTFWFGFGILLVEAIYLIVGSLMLKAMSTCIWNIWNGYMSEKFGIYYLVTLLTWNMSQLNIWFFYVNGIHAEAWRLLWNAFRISEKPIAIFWRFPSVFGEDIPIDGRVVVVNCICFCIYWSSLWIILFTEKVGVGKTFDSVVLYVDLKQNCVEVSIDTKIVPHVKERIESEDMEKVYVFLSRVIISFV
jgi:hypothetical protein